MVSEREILARLAEGLKLPPLVIKATRLEPATGNGSKSDAQAEAIWRQKRLRFTVEVKTQATPQILRTAIIQAKEYAACERRLPMVIVPYLSPAGLDELETAAVSGADLCGNGIICVPDSVLVLRSGKPNLFPLSDRIKNVYGGDTSIAARAFLLRPAFGTVKELVDFIQGRRGGITFSTVSKALGRLQEDLVISRNKAKIKLLQRDKLLEQLAGQYRPPRVVERWRGRCSMPFQVIAKRLIEQGQRLPAQLVLTGEGSAERYAVMGREPILAMYCTVPPSRLLKEAGIKVETTDRFPDLELLQTGAKRVFFDSREKNGIPYSSPIQTWLELAAGDKRQRESAEQVRSLLLSQTPEK